MPQPRVRRAPWVRMVAKAFILPPMLVSSAVGLECASKYGACTESFCCVDKDHGCFKRPGLHYAQCRPLADQVCEDTNDWECPGWESCGGKYQSCSTSKCCKEEGFGCFKRPEHAYAKCLPLPEHTCSDTAEWRCPGWELCSDNQESCEHTHCCSSVEFTCYRMHGNYAQCLRTGTCTDGDCEPVASELGQCSDAWHDCHLSGCCKRAEDHCFMKNHGYGKCMPHCDPRSYPDWLCTKRELPSEKSKLSCDSLRGRHSIHELQCSEVVDQSVCDSSYHVQGSLYRPCRWLPQSRACEMAAQEPLHCDCILLSKGCPARTVSPAAGPSGGPEPGTARGPTQSFDATTPMRSDALTALEVVLVVLASIIICCGCGCACWCAALRPR